MNGSPPGFVPWPHGSPLLEAIGGFEAHESEPGRFGFVVGPAKVNSRGLLHAGVVAAIADVAIGHTLAAHMRAKGRPAAYVTVDLSCSYLGAARLDDWVEGDVTPLKVGRRLAAGLARLTARDEPVATVTALFVPADSSSG